MYSTGLGRVDPLQRHLNTGLAVGCGAEIWICTGRLSLLPLALS